MIRRTIENILRPFNFWRTLPTESGNGKIKVSSNVGGLRFALKSPGSWDSELVNVARMLVQPGDVVWDVGANLGLYSATAAYAAGPAGLVVSIEPGLDAVSLLRQSARKRSRDIYAENIIFPAAVFNNTGKVTFNLAARSGSTNFITGFGSTQTGGIRETLDIPCFHPSELLDIFEAPQVVKIDVEGAELEVLQAADKLLSDVRPVFYVEIRKGVRDQIASIFLAKNYCLFEPADDGTRLGTESQKCCFNTIAIPHEKREHFDKLID